MSGTHDKDFGGVIRSVYDPSNNTLGVTAVATIIDGAVEVAIDAETDNIQIRDPNSGNVLSINSDGSLDVNIVSGSSNSTPVSNYSEITDVAIGATETVLTYIVPLGKKLSLTRADVSGDCIGTFEIQFNNFTNSKKRLHYTHFNDSFNYETTNYLLSAGTTITIVITNNSRDFIGSFNCNLQGSLV